MCFLHNVAGTLRRFRVEAITAAAFTAGNWAASGADATHIATFSANTLRFQSDTTSPQLLVTSNGTTVAIGRTYLVTVICSAWTSGSVKVFENTGGSLVVNGVGTFSAVIQASAIGVAITRNSANVDLTLSSISVKGMH